MDLQQKITEALEEHLTVIQQLTAMSSLILQVANELVTTLRGQGNKPCHDRLCWLTLCGTSSQPTFFL